MSREIQFEYDPARELPGILTKIETAITSLATEKDIALAWGVFTNRCATDSSEADQSFRVLKELTRELSKADGARQTDIDGVKYPNFLDIGNLHNLLDEVQDRGWVSNLISMIRAKSAS